MIAPMNGSDGTEAILYTVDGGGHIRPGGLQYLSVWIAGKTCRDINAGEMIWYFFLETLPIAVSEILLLHTWFKSV